MTHTYTIRMPNVTGKTGRLLASIHNKKAFPTIEAATAYGKFVSPGTKFVVINKETGAAVA